MIGWIAFLLIFILSFLFMTYIAKDKIAASLIKAMIAMYVVGSICIILIDNFVK